MNLYSAETAADHLVSFVVKIGFMTTEELMKLSDYLTSQAMDEGNYPLKKFLYDSAEFVESTLGDRE